MLESVDSRIVVPRRSRERARNDSIILRPTDREVLECMDLGLKLGLPSTSGAPRISPLTILGHLPTLDLRSDMDVLEAASDPCEDNDTVATWTNTGHANGSNATEATNKPVYKATGGNGGLPAIEFDGTNDQLGGTIAGSAVGDSWSVAAVLDATNGGNRTVIEISDIATSNRCVLMFFSTNT